MCRSSIVAATARRRLPPRPPVPPPRDGGFSGGGVGGVGFAAACRRSISYSKLTVTPHPPPTLASLNSARPPRGELKFGRTFSPHMLTIAYDGNLGGWQGPEIVPFGDLRLSPAASALHYGMGCFEGMKAYRALTSGEDEDNDDDDDNDDEEEEDIRLFRPDRNMKRLGDSMARLGMPGCDFDGGEVVECIKELVRLGEWSGI